MHLFLTGKPSCGKTTLIKILIGDIPNKRGFFTEEIREHGQRVGFKIVTLRGEEAVFSHQDFKSPYKVSKYGVDLETFNSLAVKELEQALNEDCDYVVIDELGGMELFSEKFKGVVSKLLDTRKIIGTVSFKEDAFLDQIKKRNDVCIVNLNIEKFSEIKEECHLILKSLCVDKIRLLEKRAKMLGFGERILIENASSSLFSIIDGLNLGKKVLVIAGMGNNGADVLSCARKMSGRGYHVNAAVLQEKRIGDEVIFQKNILEEIGIPVHYIKGDVKGLKELIRNSDFILDGILGIGIRGELPPFLKEIISLINNSNKKIVACDIPSGLSPDDGIILGEAVKADYTITFISPKQGFFLNQGKDLCGKISVVDIGISREALEK